MNAAHLHLLVNHVPVLGMIAGFLLWAAGLCFKSLHLRRAAVAGFVLVAAAAGAANLSGERAEDAVERLPGVAKPFIEQHEEAAEFALGSAIVVGLISLVGAVLFRKPEAPPAWFSGLVTVAAAVGIIILGRTAYLGGKIRHTEIRSGATATATAGEAGASDSEARQGGESEEEEDDD